MSSDRRGDHVTAWQMAVLLVEQFLDFALAIADHCYVLERGRLVLDGPRAGLTHADLRQYLSV